MNNRNDPTIFIGEQDGSPIYAFNLVRDGQGNRGYQVVQRPSQEGDPDQPFKMEFPFGYLGMGSSTNNFLPETVDFGSMDARVRGRLYPPHAANTLTLTATPTDTIRAIWIARSPDTTEYVYFAGGTRVRKVKISTNADITGDAFVDGGLFYGQPTEWGGYWWVPRTAGVGAMRLQVVDGAGADNWAELNTGGDTGALAFCTAVLAGSTAPLLIRGTSTGTISTAATDPTNNANWSAGYQIAPLGQYINGLVNHDGQVFVSTTAGLYAVDANVNGTPLTSHLANSSNTQAGRPCLEWHGKIYYPHQTGLYRSVNGLTRTVGVEVLPGYLSTRTLAPKGRVTAMAGFAHWLYVAYYDGAASSSYILAGRERESGEPGDGEMIWHMIGPLLSGEIGAMCAYQGTDSVPPRLYYSLGVAAHYLVLGKNGGPNLNSTFLDFRPGSSIHYLAPNDLDRPNTLKIAERAEIPYMNLAANDTVAVAVAWEIGSPESGVANTQIGATITGATTGNKTFDFTKGTADSGRQLYPVVTFTKNTAATMSYLVGPVTVRGKERPDQVREVQANLDIREGTPSAQQGKTPVELIDQLRTWKEAGTALTFTDNVSGVTFTCRMQDVVQDEDGSDVGMVQGFRVRVRLVEALN